MVVSQLDSDTLLSGVQRIVPQFLPTLCLPSDWVTYSPLRMGHWDGESLSLVLLLWVGANTLGPTEAQFLVTER